MIIGLYFWNFFKIKPTLEASLIVGLPAVIMACGVAVISIISHIWKSQKVLMPFTLIAYLLLTATIAVLIVKGHSADYVISPFDQLWLLVSLAAGVFGLWGTMPVLLATATFTAVEYTRGNFSIGFLVSIILCSLLPLIIGVLIWRKKSDKDEANGEDRAFRNLANELTEVASKSEVVINAIGDGVIAIDGKGIIQLINPAAQRLIGWGKQDAMTLNYKSVLQMVDSKNEPLSANSDPIQQVLNNNQQVRTNDLSLITKSDKKMTISLVVSPVGDMGSGIIAVFHDITKEKAEEREQAEFISTASHEMRTPVASIEGYLGLAINPQTAQIDARARDFILKAHASAEHLGHLFQDLLDVSKADDGRISNNPKVIDVVTFIHDVVEGLDQNASTKGLKLTFKPANEESNERIIPPVYYVNLDNDHIREIINNLIENAIKYTPAGEIVVDVNGDEDNVIISVKDSGIGIPAEDMPHLFQKFYRVDNKNTREIGGTGLGLYLSRRLAEIMGGRIWAESVYNHGSTFFVEFPRVSSQEATRLSEQAELIAQEEASQKAKVEPELAFTPEAPVTNEPPHNVPRGQALTSEQIAAYVAKQRELIQQQTTAQQPVITQPQPTVATQPTVRPQIIAIPAREQMQK